MGRICAIIHFNTHTRTNKHSSCLPGRRVRQEWAQSTVSGSVHTKVLPGGQQRSKAVSFDCKTVIKINL